MRTLIAPLALSVLLTGCVVSTDAVVPESDATWDPRLLGSWEEVDGTDRAVVSRAAANTYAIEYTNDKGRTGRFEGRLGRLGGRPVLDIWPVPRANDLPDPYGSSLLPGHVLLALDIDTNRVSVSTLEPDSLAPALRSGAVRLAYEWSEDRLLLRASTRQLRDALLPYVARAGAWREPGAWRRSLTAAAAPLRPVDPPCFEASAWREADQLFHHDPHWLGADVASSADLGGGRTLWLFGDSWIDPAGRNSRRGARMVSNSVAIQTGADPATATIAFYWGRAADGGPAPFLAERGAESLWFGSGVRVGDRLVLFFAPTLRNGTGVFGFEHVGWAAVMVENPDAEPSAWRVRPLETPANPLGVLLGFAGVRRLGEHVYALGSEITLRTHPLYVARWPAEQVRRGNLLQPEWWAGERLGWIPDTSRAMRRPIFENGQSELTIHYDSVSGRFLEVQSVGFGAADVAMRAAPVLTGPWTDPRMIYRPPEYYRPNVMIYAAKAHPELSGADLVLTYATNTFQPGELPSDSLVYYPRFVRLQRCR
jgi:hypothetical protein